MESAPDSTFADNPELPSAVFGYDIFGELFGDELAPRNTMPVWTLEEVGYTYDAPHVHTNGRITTGLYPPEYYEYEDLGLCSWEEGLHEIELFDWSQTGKSEQTKHMQSNSMSVTDVSVRHGRDSFATADDGSNNKQESARADVQLEEEELTTSTFVANHKQVNGSFPALSSPPWITSPPSATLQQAHPALSNAREENRVDVEGIATGLKFNITGYPSSDEDEDNLTGSNEQASAATGEQDAHLVGATLSQNTDTQGILDVVDRDGRHSEDAFSIQDVARPSINDGVMSRGHAEGLTASPHPSPPRFADPTQASGSTTALDMHDVMLSLATASTPYYVHQPSIQSPTQVVEGSKQIERSVEGNEEPLEHDLVAHPQLTLPVPSSEGNTVSDPDSTQLPTNTLTQAVADQTATLHAVAHESHASRQLQDQLEAAAGEPTSCHSFATALMEPDEGNNTPLMPGGPSERQPLCSPGLPSLPFRAVSSPLSSVDSSDLLGASFSPIKQDLGQQTDTDFLRTPRHASAKDSTPSPMTVDVNTPPQVSQPSLTRNIRATDLPKRSKAARSPNNISSTEEDAPVKKKAKPTSHARSRAGITAENSAILDDEDSGTVDEQSQFFTSKLAKEDLVDDDQTTQSESKPQFKVPNYASEPARVSESTIERGMVCQQPFSRSPGFHQAHSEDATVQEDHFSEVERSASLVKRPVGRPRLSFRPQPRRPRNLSRELRNLQDDTHLEKGSVHKDEALVPGRHLSLQVRMPKATVESTLEDTPAVVPTIETESARVEDDVDGDGDEEDEVDGDDEHRDEEGELDNATSPPRASIVHKKRPGATKKSASIRKRASKPTAVKHADDLSGSDSDELFRPPHIASPSPLPSTHPIAPQKIKKTPKVIIPAKPHPLYPGYGKRTTRNDVKATKASGPSTFVNEGGEDEDDDAYVSPSADGRESERSSVTADEKAKRKPGRPAKQPAKRATRAPKSATTSTPTSRTATAPSTPDKNLYGFKTRTPRRTRVTTVPSTAPPPPPASSTTASATKAKFQPGKKAKRNSLPAPPKQVESADPVRRTTRQASRAESEAREVEARESNVKLRLRSMDGGGGEV